MVLQIPGLDELSTEEAGAAVFEELRRTGHQVELEKRGARVRPALKRTDPLRGWLYELGVYLRLKCSRCAVSSLRGLSRSYWGEWLCAECVHELAKKGGELDVRGWPEPNRSDAA